MRSSADLHVGDLDLGEVLPVPRVATITRAAREAENPDLLALHLRGSVLDMLAVAREQNLIERDFVPRLRIEQRDLDRDSRLGAELLATGGKDSVGHGPRTLTGAWDWVKRARSSKHGADCSLLRASSGHRILFRDVPPRGPSHHPEFIQPHHRIISHLELQPGLLFELAQEVRLLLHVVECDLRMEPHRELALLVVRPRALQRALHAPHHDLRPEDATRAITGRAFRRHRLPERWPHALPGHLDQPQLGDGKRARAGPVAT